ncbi:MULTISPECIES: primosomal protein N' [unclassified Roseobacter]|uniref:primosomal protein N' n=1 Tax=unclassified Roseobacter TaxID=196798 RepID=UPI0030EF09F2
MEADFFTEGTLVGVLTAEPLDRVLDYRAPEGGCEIGAFVEVPLGPRRVIGVVWGRGQGGYDPTKIRKIANVVDVAPMRPEMRQFLERAAQYTFTPLSAMLRLATRAPALGASPQARRLYTRGATTPARMTDARARVMDVIDEYGGAALSQTELAQAAGVSSAVIKGLVEQGALAQVEAPRDAPFPALDHHLEGKNLSPDQADISRRLRHKIAAGGFGASLLNGVTGSGKTEVYLEAVAEALAKGQQALVLLPEIALSAEFLTRVEARFGARPAEWHSGITMAERRRVWKMVGEGAAQLVVGARSSLFLPFRDLGLIVVDEEHDASYKQEDGVFYNARDMAVLRGSVAGAQVILASATPSLETWANAEAGKYERFDLPARFGASELPQMSAIDMRLEDVPSGQWISPSLAHEVAARISAGEQSLLFLNRRGFAPITLCRACGVQIACDHCDARMVEHRFQKRLMCHQCGETKDIPETCPACGVEGKLTALGPGVERIAEEAQALFPQARVAILSSDLFGSARALKAQIAEIAEGGCDIIIGTQLVAKGHNFPNLTLVGVVDADLGLHGSDLRAAERSFQLMRQVAGRAGRAEKAGVAIMQTYQPEHPVITAILANDDEGFWRAEAAMREAAAMPPYGRLAGIVISSPDLAECFDLGNHLARHDGALRQIEAQVFGPAPAPVARVRGWHRVRLLVKAPKGAPIQAALAHWLNGLKYSNKLRLSVDIDPQSFY